MGFVAVKLKGIKQYILNTEPAFSGTEPEEHAFGRDLQRKCHEACLYKTKTPVGTGVLKMLCFLGNVFFGLGP